MIEFKPVFDTNKLGLKGTNANDTAEKVMHLAHQLVVLVEGSRGEDQQTLLEAFGIQFDATIAALNEIDSQFIGPGGVSDIREGLIAALLHYSIPF